MDITIQNRFTDPKYTNWLRLHRLFTHLHTSLLPFIQHQGRELWYDVIATWIKNQSRCTTCRASDITFNPRRVPRSKCWSITCPMGVCGRWVEEIARAHAYGHLGKIAFANCDVQRWPLEYWEFAKAFMCDMGAGRCKEDKGDASKDGTPEAGTSSKSGNGRLELKDNKLDESRAQNKLVYNETTTAVGNKHNKLAKSGADGVSLKQIKQVQQSKSAVRMHAQDIKSEQQFDTAHKTAQVDKSSSNNGTSSKSKSNRILVGGKVMIVGKRRQNTKSNKPTNKPEFPDKPNKLSNKEPTIESKEQNVSRPLSQPKTDSQSSQSPSKENNHTQHVKHKPKSTSEQQPEKLHSNRMKLDTPKTIQPPLSSKQASQDAKYALKPISNTIDSLPNASTATRIPMHNQKEYDENPDEYTDEHIDLIHLLSFLVNCTALHTSARKSRDLEGGLSARHVIRIKKLMRLIEEIRNQILLRVDDQLFTQITSLIVEMQSTISKQFPGEFNPSKAIHQVLERDQCKFETFSWRSVEVNTISRHLQHIKKVLLSRQSDATDVNEFMKWLHMKQNRKLLLSVQAVFDMDRFLGKLPPKIQTELAEQLIEPSCATQTEAPPTITQSSTQTDAQPVSQPPFTSNTTASFHAEPTSSVAKSSFDQIDLVEVELHNEGEDDRKRNGDPFDQLPPPSSHQLPDILMNGFVGDSSVASMNNSHIEMCHGSINLDTFHNNPVDLSTHSIDLVGVPNHLIENPIECCSTAPDSGPNPYSPVDLEIHPKESVDLDSNFTHPLEVASVPDNESIFPKHNDHRIDSILNNSVDKIPAPKLIPEGEDTLSAASNPTTINSVVGVSEHILSSEFSELSNVPPTKTADYINHAFDQATYSIVSETQKQCVPKNTYTRNIRNNMVLLRDVATETQTIETKSGYTQYDLNDVEFKPNALALGTKQKLRKEPRESENTTSTMESDLSAAEKTTSAKDEEPGVHEKTTSAKVKDSIASKKKTSTNDGELKAAENTPSAKYEKPSASESTTSAKDEEHRAPENTSSAKDNKPSAPENTPSAKDEEPSASETTKSGKDNKQSAHEISGSAKDEVSSALKTTPSAKDKELSAPENTPSAKDNKRSAHQKTTSSKDNDLNPNLNPRCTENQDLDETKSSINENRHALEENYVFKTTRLSNASTQTLLLTWNAMDQEYLFTGSRGYTGTIKNIECYDLRPGYDEGGCVVVNNNGRVTVLYKGEPEYKMVG